MRLPDVYTVDLKHRLVLRQDRKEMIRLTLLLALYCWVSVLPAAYGQERSQTGTDTAPMAFAHSGTYETPTMLTRNQRSK